MLTGRRRLRRRGGPRQGTVLVAAGALPLVLLWPGLRTGPSGARLVVEVALVTGALAALLWGLMAAAQLLPW